MEAARREVVRNVLSLKIDVCFMATREQGNSEVGRLAPPHLHLYVGAFRAPYLHKRLFVLKHTAVVDVSFLCPFRTVDRRHQIIIDGVVDKVILGLDELELAYIGLAQQLRLYLFVSRLLSEGGKHGITAVKLASGS